MAQRTRIARFTEADRTFDEVRELVEDAVTEAMPLADGQWCYVRDLADAWVVVEVEGAGDTAPGLYRLTYTVSDGGTVTLGAPEPVQSSTTYAPITESVDTVPGRVLEASDQPSTAGGRVFHVELVAYGTSRNGAHYPRRVMEAAVPHYEGAKAFDHHRTAEELATSTVRGLVGHYRNVTAGDRALEADLHLLPGAAHIAEALDASLEAQGQGLPPVVGISHDVVSRWRPATVGGAQVREAVEIVRTNSCDVVADPSAGGRATRMVAGGTGPVDPEEGPMTLKELLAMLRAANAEKRAELLSEHATLIEEWGLDAAAIDRILTQPEADAPKDEPKADAPAPAPKAEDKEPATVGAATEATYTASSLTGGMLVSRALEAAGVTGRAAETVRKHLPQRFTEAELVAAVDGYAGMARELEAAGMEPRVPHVAVGTEERERQVAGLDAFFGGDYSTFASFKEAFCVITGESPWGPRDTEDLAVRILRESIGNPFALYDSARRTESLTVGSWTEILGDSITRRMVSEYQVPQYQDWRKLVSDTPPVNDFRTQHRMRLGGYGALPTVAEAGPYTALTSPGDEEATYAIGKLGGTEDLTLEMIANDDVNAISKIPTRLGRAAAITLYRTIMDILPTNANIYDGVALFASGHANTTVVALGGSGASQLRTKMRQQAAYGESRNLLSFVPRYLVVPSALEELAYQLSTSAVALPSGAPVGAASNTPNLHRGLEVIVVDHYSDTNDWFMVADPSACPTIEVGFYRGRQDPELFAQSDPTQGSMFTNDKLTWKIRHIYGSAVLDYRGFQRATQP